MGCTVPVFLSTPSARRATKRTPCRTSSMRNFYPRPPRGGRPSRCRFGFPCTRYFYPRPPRGGRQDAVAAVNTAETFLSTPSARRATLFQRRPGAVKEISIHALREEGDCNESGRKTGQEHFYPRPPRGGRQPKINKHRKRNKFLSTPSARRATRQGHQDHRGHDISIHALREEGDRLWPLTSPPTC